MMSIRKITPLVIVAIACYLMTLTSCEKVYTGQLIFWWDAAFEQQMNTIGVSNVAVYESSAFKGTLDIATKQFTAAPACNDAGSVTVSKDLGAATSGTFSYTFKLRDASNNIISTTSDNITLQDGCNTYQLQ
jgi:hypothetical protein